MPRKQANTKNPRGVFEKVPGTGVWWILYYDENGKRHREKIGPKKLAMQVYQKRKTDIREGNFFPEKIGKQRAKLLLNEAITRYLEEARVNKKHPRDDVRHAAIWLKTFDGKTLEEILPADLEAWKRKRLNDGLALATVKRDLAYLRHLYNLAIRDGFVEKNPVVSVKVPKVNNARTRYLTDEEEARLREAMDSADFAKVEFAILTGLRRSEQFSLRWENVDLGSEVLTVPQTKHGELRHVPLSAQALDILRALPSRMRSAWVFPSKKGDTPFDAQNFYTRVFVPALRAASIDNFHWHDLRHTFGSRLAMAGADLRSIQELMGHKTIQMTQRYSHLSSSHLRRAVNLVQTSSSGPAHLAIAGAGKG